MNFSTEVFPLNCFTQLCSRPKRELVMFSAFLSPQPMYYLFPTSSSSSEFCLLLINVRICGVLSAKLLSPTSSQGCSWTHLKILYPSCLHFLLPCFISSRPCQIHQLVLLHPSSATSQQYLSKGAVALCSWQRFTEDFFMVALLTVAALICQDANMPCGWWEMASPIHRCESECALGISAMCLVNEPSAPSPAVMDVQVLVREDIMQSNQPFTSQICNGKCNHGIPLPGWIWTVKNDILIIRDPGLAPQHTTIWLHTNTGPD